MSKCVGSICGVAILVVLVSQAGPAWATLENLKTFKQAYSDKDTKSYSCKVCHLNAIGKKGEMNPYGAVLQQLTGEGNAKALTVEDLRAVEKDDADQDGVSNLDEITAGTSPGDATSLPKP